MNNTEFSRDPKFVAACDKVQERYGFELKPSTAQASKYRRGYGAAYTAERAMQLGGRSGQHERAETVDDQRGRGVYVAQEYGPYSATPLNQPKQKK